MNTFIASGPIPPLEEVAIKLTAEIPSGPADIIEGLLPRQGQLVIAGQTNTGKSLVALEIISALTTGNPLWGELQPTLQARKVLYVLAEHHDAVIQRLWQKTQLPMGSEVYLLGPEALGADKWLVTGGKPNLLAIDKLKKWGEGCDLIVFDPLGAFFTGNSEDENSNLVMRLVLDSMGSICQASGASCLVLAHQGKPMVDQRGQEHARKSYAIRGGSAVEDAATNIFYMDKAEGEAAQKAADGKMFELRLRKYKGNAPESYRLLRDPNNLTHTLLSNRPFGDIQKIAAQGDVARLQAVFPDYNFRTCVKIAAAVRGISEETMKRHLGVTS